jgi:molybdopterin molybdotransferase/putative molybdopterin biosynthesis protein
LGKDFVRADTGDDFPDKFDAVIPIEKVSIGTNGKGMQLDQDVRVEKGMSIRPMGSSVQEGQLLINAHHRLNATDLAVLAMGNIAEVPVYRQPVVAFIPTGTELVAPGSSISRGVNIESNSYMAKPLLEEYGAKVKVYPIVRDEPLTLEEMLSRAVEVCDLILLNGGSSKGEEDYALRLLEKKGKVLFHWTQCGPGRPAAMADYLGKPVIVVPGPPYGCLNVLQWLIHPIIAYLIGLPKASAYTVKAILMEAIESPRSISFLLGANITRNDEGKIEAHLINFKRYGALTCLAAGGFLHTIPGQTPWKAGDEIEVTLLRPVD